MNGPELGDRAQVAFIGLCAALSAVLEVLFVPLYVGSVLVPLVVLFAVAGNYALPRLAYGLIPSTGAAVTPFLCWLLPVLVLALLPRPEGDVLILGAGGQQYTFFGLLLGGALVGTVTIVLLKGPSGPMRAPEPPSRPTPPSPPRKQKPAKATPPKAAPTKSTPSKSTPRAAHRVKK